jgi:mono/diheme cytochrome c family protein
MLRFLLGLLIGLLILPAFAYWYVASGKMPVATAAPPLPLERRLAHMALNAKIDKSAPEKPGVPADEPNLMAGAKLYVVHCAVCHGMPGGEKSAIAKGMFPEPPELFHFTGVTDDPPGESYWKIENGIRLTGMPAYKGSLSETEMWQIAQLVATGNKVPASVSDWMKKNAPSIKFR